MSIPELVDLQEKYKAKGLVIVGISVDDEKVSKGELVAFKEKMRINYPLLRANDKVNHLAQVDHPFWLVVDDYHVIQNQVAHQMIRFLLESPSSFASSHCHAC